MAMCYINLPVTDYWSAGLTQVQPGQRYSRSAIHPQTAFERVSHGDCPSLSARWGVTSRLVPGRIRHESGNVTGTWRSHTALRWRPA